ncbi:MAG: hypothetical protein Q9165_008758 [Trypethelium subeluteriae]
MVRYLSSDFISSEDRHYAISHMNLFEDLDSMYVQIFQKIRKSAPDKRSWATVQKLFEWVAFAGRPLTATELRMALSLAIGKPTKSSRFLAKNLNTFQKIISRISGALVEFGQDKTARFIHLSVLEFLIDSLTSDRPEKDRLRISPASTHCSIAMNCLSYLVHDIPRGPLCGLSPSRPSTRDLISKYPLLLFSAQFWTHHGYLGLEKRGNETKDTLQQQSNLLSMITQFFLDSISVTVWTEASWTFKFEPSLGRLIDHAPIVFDLNDTRAFDELMRDPDTQLPQLRQALDLLATGWYVDYTVKRILENKEVYRNTFEIPSEAIAVLLRRMVHSKNPRSFPFPVSLSDDLRQVAILSYLVRIRLPTGIMDQPSKEFTAQELVFTSLEQALDNSQYVPRAQEHLWPIWEPESPDHWYDIKFSSNACYMILLCGPGRPGNIDYFYAEWSLAIYQDQSSWNNAPNFQVVDQFKTNISGHALSRPVVFHPSEPLIAISRLGVTSIRLFAKSREPFSRLIRSSKLY